jgi:aminoglycoside phosphotransferase (APT) family kinase protein
VDLPRRDPDEVAGILRSWLERVAGFTDVEVTNVAIPGATGFSNETIMFDASWSDAGAPASRELVARIAPSSYQVFPDDTFLLQFHVMRALGDATDVPMATVHWLEQDETWFGRPFWIMQRVHGEIPTDAPPYASAGWLADAAPAQQARAWASGIEAMAAIHTVRLDDLDVPAGHLRVHEDGVGAEIDRYARFLRWAEGDEPHPGARRALAWLRRNQPPAPVEGPALVWGDARLSNLVYRDFEVVAVLDWEMATVADPMLDLGWWIFADDTLTKGSGCERLPAFDSVDEAAARWAAVTGRSTDALDYYLVFAGMRFTVIMLRMGKLLCDMGFVPPAFAYDNLVSQGLDRQLARV